MRLLGASPPLPEAVAAVTRPVARIVLAGAIARVCAPYEHREIVKSVPGRRWDHTGQYWTIPTKRAADLAEALRAHGADVIVTRADNGTEQTTGWAAALLDAVGPERAERTVRALTHVLHPDVDGGDERLMRELLAAHERRAEKGRQ